MPLDRRLEGGDLSLWFMRVLTSRVLVLVAGLAIGRVAEGIAPPRERARRHAGAHGVEQGAPLTGLRGWTVSATDFRGIVVKLAGQAARVEVQPD